MGRFQRVVLHRITLIRAGTFEPRASVQPEAGGLLLGVAELKNSTGTSVASSLASQSSGGFRNSGQTAVDIYVVEWGPVDSATPPATG